MQSARIALVGASGLAGEAALRVLEDRNFPLAEVHALTSDRAVGQRLEFRGRSLPVRDVETFDFARADVALFFDDAAVSLRCVPRATAAGCVVVDGSSAFRAERDVPLVVPEINAPEIAQFRARRIVASPSSGAIAVSLLLKPLQAAAELDAADIVLHLPVSEAGRDAVEELARQSAELLQGKGPVVAAFLERRIAFDVLPQVGELDASGRSAAEVDLQQEVRRLLQDDAITIDSTAVRVPVFFGLAAVANVRLRKPLSVEDARACLAAAPGLRVIGPAADAPYPTPALDAVDQDLVLVGRVRAGGGPRPSLNLWLAADNVRKGAATNGVQIAEILVRDYL